MTLAHFKCKYFSQVSNLTWFCLLAICLQRFRHFSFPWLYMGLALSRILFESLILKSFMAETASYGQNYSELVMQSNKRRYLLFLSKINNVSKTAIYCWLKLLQPTADANFHKSPARGNLPNFPSAPNFNIVMFPCLLFLLFPFLCSLCIRTSVPLLLLLFVSQVLYYQVSSFHWCESSSLVLCHLSLFFLGNLKSWRWSGKYGVDWLSFLDCKI